MIDVETAFLEGDLEEEIYMELPEGYKEFDPTVEDDEYVLLEKSIYGLVQAARQWWKKLVKTLKKIGFKGGCPDPCLYTKRDKNGLVIIALYVDDCLCIGHDKAIEETIKQLKQEGLSLKIEGTLKDYLSCEIRFNMERTKAWIGQPHLLKSLEAKFGEKARTMQTYKTPGTPGSGIQRPNNETMLLSDKEQKEYRSGVGMLLYLVKHSRPDIGNVTRELSKVMDGATHAAMKELMRTIKFVLSTKEWGLKVAPTTLTDKWELKVYSDSDFAGDKDTRISVTGYILYLMGVPIAWRSKGQKGVTLSSSEAEYVALSEAVKEVKFAMHLIESMGLPIQYPIMVYVDNIGAMFMAENVTTSNRTKHVDTRYHFLREHVEDGIVKIQFVRSGDNDADVLTKNVNSDTFNQHRVKFMEEEKNLDRSFMIGRVSRGEFERNRVSFTNDCFDKIDLMK